jgi:structural maintenance of chromosome 4
LLNNQLYQAYVSTCEENVTGGEAKKEKYDELFEHEKVRLVEVESRLSVIEKTYEATNAEYNRIHSEVERTSEEFAAFERRDVKLNEDLKHNKAQSKKLQSAVEKDVQKENELLTESHAAEQRVAGMKASISDQKAAKAEEETRLEEIMVSLSSATSELRDQLEQKQGIVSIIICHSLYLIIKKFVSNSWSC